MRRPIPPLSTLRSLPDPEPLRRWAAGVRSHMRPWELDGIHVISVPFVSPPRPRSYGGWGHWMAPTLGRALGRLRREWPFDLVHAHSIVPPGYAASRWTRGAGTRLAVSAHGPDIIHVAEASPIARRALGRGAHQRRPGHRKQPLVGAALRGDRRPRPAERGGAPRHRRARGDPERRERPTIVTVAHLVARKRHAVVLHALAELELDYVVIGDGPGREPLERLAGELGIAERVTFTGQLEHERALAEARRCHAYVMPGWRSLRRGLRGGDGRRPARDRRARRGRPRGHRGGGPRKLLVPPDDHRALARTLADLFREGPERLAAARETALRNFTRERCGQATVEAYERALA